MKRLSLKVRCRECDGTGIFRWRWGHERGWGDCISCRGTGRVSVRRWLAQWYGDKRFERQCRRAYRGGIAYHLRWLKRPHRSGSSDFDLPF